MCMSCGCMEPDEDHGDQRHITMQDLQDAARAAGTNADEVINNIQQTYQRSGRQTAGMSGGQQGGGAPSM